MSNDAEEKEEVDVTDLAAQEIIVNELARTLARKWRYRDDVFTVHLTSRLEKCDMSVFSGSPVRIVMLWPDVLPVFQSKLRSAFATIKKMNLYQPFAVATFAYMQREQEGAKKWVRAKLGDDLADTLGNLIPKHRLVVTKTVTIQVTDRITGTVVEETTSVTGDHRDAPFAMWNKVSQLVFKSHADTVDFSEAPSTTDLVVTPEPISDLLDKPAWPERVDVGNFLPTQMVIIK